MAQTVESMRNAVLNGGTHGINFAVIKRTGTGDNQGDVYTFSSLDQIDEFIETRRIPDSVRVTKSS